MKREFEKLGKRLDSADLNDIMPSFDKQAEWSDLQERLQAADKKRVIPIWFRYAAAVVAGLLLGGVSVNQWLSNGGVTAPIAVEQTAPTTQPTIIINQPSVPSYNTIENAQTVEEAVATVERKEKPIVKEHQVKEAPKEIIATTKNEEKIKPAPTTIAPKQIEQQEEVVAEIKSPLKRKAVHLLDIDNEDRQIVLSDPESASSTFQQLKKQVAHTHTMSASSTNQPIVLRKMLKK
ncbi:MAG: hypothetical protein R2800_12465 [Flavipsychrobacter sp.]